MPRWNLNLEDRFLSYVNKTDSCWLWTGDTNGRGYGSIHASGKTIGAHRLSYQLYVGDLKGLFVLHRCDVTLCVNPEHLFLGTQKDNVHDAIAKGRLDPADTNHTFGENNYNSSMSESDVKNMRLMRTHGWKVRSLANLFPVNMSTVSAICLGRAWRQTC